jgi:hypothetical protein
MEFSRAVAYACFTVGKWLMVATGILFLLLAATQYWRAEANANPYLTIGTGIGCGALALFLRYLAKRIQNMNKA